METQNKELPDKDSHQINFITLKELNDQIERLNNKSSAGVLEINVSTDQIL